MQAKIAIAEQNIEDVNEESLLRQMVEVIVREISPEAIVLFGSRARGNARADSDVDLLVIEKEPFSLQRSRGKGWRVCKWHCVNCHSQKIFFCIAGMSSSTGGIR
jgi:predicted nucleotidyltransferase